MNQSFQKEIREGGEEGCSQDGLHPEDQGLLVHRYCEDSFTISLPFFFFFTTLRGMWDLSSLTRDRTCAPCDGGTES